MFSRFHGGLGALDKWFRANSDTRFSFEFFKLPIPETSAKINILSDQHNFCNKSPCLLLHAWRCRKRAPFSVFEARTAPRIVIMPLGTKMDLVGMLGRCLAGFFALM